MIFRNLLILLGFLIVSGTAQAEPKPFPLWWPSNHEKWETAKHHTKLLENGKHQQNSQWRDEDWYAQDWISQRGGDGMALIRGFYDARIIQEQDEDDGTAILVVGPNFYRLSGFDKRRVVQTVDAVYGITRTNPHAVIMLTDWHTGRHVGLYNEYGLQVQ